MSKISRFVCYSLLLSTLSPCLTGCRRSSQDLLDDTRSCGRHMARAFRSLGGTPNDSRQIHDPNEFMPSSQKWGRDQFVDDMPCGELVPIDDPDMPPVAAFRETKNDAVSTFTPIYFPYNSDLIKGNENNATVQRIAEEFKSHPNRRLLIEGHCDERGPESYNLALGLRRAHAVRNALLQSGVASGQMQVISFGKERPSVVGHDENAWSKNRRAEFKTCEG